MTLQRLVTLDDNVVCWEEFYFGPPYLLTAGSRLERGLERPYEEAPSVGLRLGNVNPGGLFHLCHHYILDADRLPSVLLTTRLPGSAAHPTRAPRRRSSPGHIRQSRSQRRRTCQDGQPGVRWVT